MEKKFFAEHNTDEVIRGFFPDYDYKGVVIEVGGGTPEYISMSRHFKINGWRAIIFEPNPIFIKQHEEIGNETYQYACSNEDKDNVDFTIVHQNPGARITDQSFSSLDVKESYQSAVGGNKNFYNSLKKTIIKVNVRKLDTILSKIKLDKIDVLSIDVEGWELEVMDGLSIIKPQIIVLENMLHDNKYNEYMDKRGYSLMEKVEINYIYKLK